MVYNCKNFIFIYFAYYFNYFFFKLLENKINYFFNYWKIASKPNLNKFIFNFNLSTNSFFNLHKNLLLFFKFFFLKKYINLFKVLLNLHYKKKKFLFYKKKKTSISVFLSRYKFNAKIWIKTFSIIYPKLFKYNFKKINKKTLRKFESFFINLKKNVLYKHLNLKFLLFRFLKNCSNFYLMKIPLAYKINYSFKFLNFFFLNFFFLTNSAKNNLTKMFFTMSFSNKNVKKKNFFLRLKYVLKSKKIHITFTDEQGKVLFYITSSKIGLKTKKERTFTSNYALKLWPYLLKKLRLFKVKKFILIFKIKRAKRRAFKYRQFYLTIFNLCKKKFIKCKLVVLNKISHSGLNAMKSKKKRRL